MKVLFSLAALYLGLVGLGMTLVPAQFGIGAVPPDAPPALLAFLRIFGGPCLGIAVLDWSVRNAEPSATRRAIILGNAVGFAVVAAVDVWGLFHGAREIAKLFLVIHLGFALAFACQIAPEAVRPRTTR
jgi:hypothetical protein